MSGQVSVSMTLYPLAQFLWSVEGIVIHCISETAGKLPMITIEPSRAACMLLPPEFQTFRARVLEKAGEHF
jgi:hypothetical protein